MGIIEVCMLSLGLAMDAFAVSICKGLSMPKMKWKSAIKIGLYFGFFQAMMPVIGYLLGVNFQSIISNVAHWIAFILLSIIGINMIKEAFEDETDSSNDSVEFKELVVLAIATSIDALVVGITFAFLQVNITFPAIMIGIITFIMSIIGVKIGNVFGDKYEKKAMIAGGIILILLGIKILLEHFGII